MAYDKGGNFKRRWCSNECMFAAKDTKPTFICATCGKETLRSKSEANGGYNYAQRHCSRKCAHIAQTHPEGTLDKHGYKMIRVNGKSVPEHRYVMEQHLGRPLRPEETVHHRNGLRTDSRIENLQLFASRHPRGQAIDDQIAFIISLAKDYPAELAQAGYRLLPLESQEATDALLSDRHAVFNVDDHVLGALSATG